MRGRAGCRRRRADPACRDHPNRAAPSRPEAQFHLRTPVEEPTHRTSGPLNTAVRIHRTAASPSSPLNTAGPIRRAAAMASRHSATPHDRHKDTPPPRDRTTLRRRHRGDFRTALPPSPQAAPPHLRPTTPLRSDRAMPVRRRMVEVKSPARATPPLPVGAGTSTRQRRTAMPDHAVMPPRALAMRATQPRATRPRDTARLRGQAELMVPATQRATLPRAVKDSRRTATQRSDTTARRTAGSNGPPRSSAATAPTRSNSPTHRSPRSRTKHPRECAKPNPSTRRRSNRSRSTIPSRAPTPPARVDAAALHHRRLPPRHRVPIAPRARVASGVLSGGSWCFCCSWSSARSRR
ncbi:hypothetical protein APR12_003871 [Nocardia amikacinitolerans]|nr:hypothetical protein [Nocardia amikacinitolerans]